MDFFFENGLRGIEALCFLFQVHSLLYLPSHNPEGRIYHFHVITEENRWPRVGKPLAWGHTAKPEHSRNGKSGLSFQCNQVSFYYILTSCSMTLPQPPRNLRSRPSGREGEKELGSQLFPCNPPNNLRREWLTIPITHWGNWGSGSLK